MDKADEEMSYDCAPENKEGEEWTSSGEGGENSDFSIDEESDDD